MTYNSILQLIGIKKEITLSYSKAKQIEKVMNDEGIPSDFTINLDGMSFKKSAIKYLEVNEDGGMKDDHDKDLKKFYEEELENRKKTLGLPKDKLAKNLEVFKTFYQAMMGQKPVESQLASAESIQLDFFKANQKRTICDLHLFKPVMQTNRSVLDVWESGVVGIIERAVMRDMELCERELSTAQ